MNTVIRPLFSVNLSTRNTLDRKADAQFVHNEYNKYLKWQFLFDTFDVFLIIYLEEAWGLRHTNVLVRLCCLSLAETVLLYLKWNLTLKSQNPFKYDHTFVSRRTMITDSIKYSITKLYPSYHWVLVDFSKPIHNFHQHCFTDKPTFIHADYLGVFV